MLAALASRLQSSPLRHDLGEVLGPAESTVDGKPYGITATVGVSMTRLTSRLTSRFFEVFWGVNDIKIPEKWEISFGGQGYSIIFNDHHCSSLQIPRKNAWRSMDFSLHMKY